MDAASYDTFCSLDMLAEVASATLQNDPTLISNRRVKYNGSKANMGYPSKKHSTNSEKLTLDQIRVLSDKMLLEMFAELICDEIRKNYSFKCYLVPDKCSQIFKSFGSEARARCKMKLHLQTHINELIAEEKDQICEKFTAEPLHVRRKRLKELNAKSVRKKKRGKQLQYNKKKKDSSVEYFPTDDEFKNKNKKSVLSSAYRHSKNPLYIYPPKPIENNYVNDFEKCSGKHFVQDLEDTSSELISGTQDQTVLPMYSESVNGYYDDRASYETVSNVRSGQKFYSRRKTKKKKYVSPSNSDYVVKWNVDFDDTSLDNTSIVDLDATQNFHESYIPSHHDHTYTSIFGKTYNELTSGEYNKVVNRITKEGNRSHRCTNSDHPLVIPTPPFPYVYVPILPHIAEIQEIGNDLKPTCSQCTNFYIEGFHENNSNIISKKSFKREKYLENLGFIKEENERNTEDDENTPSDSCVEDIASESEVNSEASDSKIPDANFNVEDVLATDCPENLQSIEKKLALKCIRALRTKKKDERGPLVCQICKNKSFTAQATLMYHYRSHAGIKPFSCTLCEATFTRQHSLNYHMLIHNNKSRFVCTDCGRNFRHPSHYKEHLRRHTGETPYECTDCNLRFKTRNTYKRHLKTRHGKILTAQGIRLLSVEEFYKVRTSPRKKIFSSTLADEGDQETQWPENLFSQRDFYL